MQYFPFAYFNLKIILDTEKTTSLDTWALTPYSKSTRLQHDIHLHLKFCVFFVLFCFVLFCFLFVFFCIGSLNSKQASNNDKTFINNTLKTNSSTVQSCKLIITKDHT